MVKIRLRRTGAKKQANYRLVVTDSRTSRDGRFIEIVGHYNPRAEPSVVKISEDRVLYWLSVGAQPTDPVKKLLEKLGALDRFARLKKGADLEELLAEATAAREENSDVPEVQAQVEAKTSAKAEPDEEASGTVEETSEEAPSESEESSSTDDDED